MNVIIMLTSLGSASAQNATVSRASGSKLISLRSCLENYFLQSVENKNSHPIIKHTAID